MIHNDLCCCCNRDMHEHYIPHDHMFGLYFIYLCQEQMSRGLLTCSTFSSSCSGLHLASTDTPTFPPQPSVFTFFCSKLFLSKNANENKWTEKHIMTYEIGTEVPNSKVYLKDMQQHLQQTSSRAAEEHDESRRGGSFLFYAHTKCNVTIRKHVVVFFGAHSEESKFCLNDRQWEKENHTCVSRKHLLSRLISSQKYLPETKRSFPVTSRAKCFITLSAPKSTSAAQACFQFAWWFAANCNSNLFVWICG